MNGKLLTAFLVATLALAQGCIIHQDSHNGGGGGGGTVVNTPPPEPGDVTFTWSFAGQSCSDIPQIKSLAIDIPGETLQNNGVYPCLANNYPGITLHDFAPGTYSFTIQALSYSNEPMYAGSGSFTINGDKRVNIDLTPVGGPTSYAYLTWRFPANQTSSNPTCAQASVTTVDVSIDGDVPYTAQCTDGQTAPGLQTPLMNPGTHTITFVAKNSAGRVYYRFSGTLQTFNGAPVSGDYNLNWAVGGAAIKWSITNGTLGQTCQQAGITSMSINFRDSNGNMILGQNGETFPCTASYVSYDFLPVGTLEVYVVGYGTNNAFYSSNQAAPPTINVVGGGVVDPNNPNPINVQVFKQ